MICDKRIMVNVEYFLRIVAICKCREQENDNTHTPNGLNTPYIPKIITPHAINVEV